MDLDVTETGAIFTGVRERVGWGEGRGGAGLVWLKPIKVLLS